LAPRDVQHTLLQLPPTALPAIFAATARQRQHACLWWWCDNAALMQALQQQMPDCHLQHGRAWLAGHQVEAAALPGWPGAFAIDYLPTCRKLPAHPDAESWGALPGLTLGSNVLQTTANTPSRLVRL
jgi:hypothetical protein